MNSDHSSSYPDAFDRAHGQLDGLTGNVTTKPSTVQTTTPLVGNMETWIVQTVHVPEVGQTIFLQLMSAERNLRLVLPPAVSRRLYRQQDAIAHAILRRSARKAAATRKARGIEPAFLKRRKGAKR